MNIAESASTEDCFLVKESSFINYLFAVIFLIIAIAGFVTMSNATNLSPKIYYSITFLAIVPAAFYFKSGFNNIILFKVNMDGIFYKSSHVTNWSNFVNAYLVSDEVPVSTGENFFILIEYYNPKDGLNYRIKLPLSASRDKSEDQLLAAIVEFYKKYQHNNTAIPSA